MALAMNDQVRKEANLRLLQRRSDRTISDILGSATHVVLYEFQQSSQSWEKSNVEGSLFLVSCAAGYQLIILNRNSSENYHLAVTKDLQLQHKDPYLMFKQLDVASGNTAIRGIWFHNANERKQILSLLSNLVQQLKSMPAATPSPLSAATMDQSEATAALLSTLGIAGNSNMNGKGANSIAQGATTTTATVVAAGHAVTSTPIMVPVVASSASVVTLPASTADTTSTPEPHQRYPPSSSPSSPAAGHAPLLDKKSLQLALLSLIQDDRFLDLLHAQYLKVAHARAGRSNSNTRAPGNGSS